MKILTDETENPWFFITFGKSLTFLA